MMDELKSQEHALKETLKRIVDSSQNRPEWMKAEVKSIIDAGKTPEEIAEGLCTFFFTSPLW